jgi:omega-amidase
MTNLPEVPTPAADDVRYYSTPSMTVEWRASRCQHSGRCVRALPRVFSPARRPWIQLGDFGVDTVEAAVAQCPSGALQFIRHGANSEPNRTEGEP